MGDTYRAKVQRWYSSRRWKERRARQLHAYPLCKMCLVDGHTTAATIADHRTPHKGDEYSFWNGALDSLCAHCHNSTKKLIENGKQIIRIGVDGWPI